VQMVTPLNNCNNNNHLNRKIVVSLDDKYVGVVFEETSDKIFVISQDNESHNRFEIPKCKAIMTWSSSISKRMVVEISSGEQM
jgi:hypothetical protein